MRNVMQPNTGFSPDSHFAYLVRSPLARGWKLHLRFPADRGHVVGLDTTAVHVGRGVCTFDLAPWRSQSTRRQLSPTQEVSGVRIPGAAGSTPAKCRRSPQCC